MPDLQIEIVKMMRLGNITPNLELLAFCEDLCGSNLVFVTFKQKSYAGSCQKIFTFCVLIKNLTALKGALIGGGASGGWRDGGLSWIK